MCMLVSIVCRINHSNLYRTQLKKPQQPSHAETVLDAMDLTPVTVAVSSSRVSAAPSRKHAAPRSPEPEKKRKSKKAKIPKPPVHCVACDSDKGRSSSIPYGLVPLQHPHFVNRLCPSCYGVFTRTITRGVADAHWTLEYPVFRDQAARLRALCEEVKKPPRHRKPCAKEFKCLQGAKMMVSNSPEADDDSEGSKVPLNVNCLVTRSQKPCNQCRTLRMIELLPELVCVRDPVCD